jgi:hypothetical protein
MTIESNFPTVNAMADIAATTHEASQQWSVDLNAAWTLSTRREILAARIEACEAMRERLLRIEADTRVYVAICDAIAPPLRENVDGGEATVSA